MAKQSKGRGALGFLYGTAPGRVILKAAASRPLSKAAGALLDSPLSKPLIKPFVEKNHIQLSEYRSDSFSCFNDCFTREIRPELRPFPADPQLLPSPCDGLLTVYPVQEGLVLPIKQSRYSIRDLLDGSPDASRYSDGLCLVFRLCVDHYHRYSYIDDGRKGPNVFIPGELHTVRPIALEALPVFVRNCREYTLMDTEHFGRVCQVEVGAMLVGRILNHHGEGQIHRAAEKGMFLYGGSTIVLLLEKGQVQLRQDLLDAGAQGIEVPVRMGEALGRAST